MIGHRLTENGVVISKDGMEMTLLGSELQTVFYDWERFAVFRQEVLEEVKKLVKSGSLPESAITNDDFIDDVVRVYEQMKGDDYDEVQIKLGIALSEVSYDEYA